MLDHTGKQLLNEATRVTVCLLGLRHLVADLAILLRASLHADLDVDQDARCGQRHHVIGSLENVISGIRIH